MYTVDVTLMQSSVYLREKWRTISRAIRLLSYSLPKIFSVAATVFTCALLLSVV